MRRYETTTTTTTTDLDPEIGCSSSTLACLWVSANMNEWAHCLTTVGLTIGGQMVVPDRSKAHSGISNGA